MSRRQNKGAHLETEKGYAISKKEYRSLRFRLPAIGFAFTERSRITDFVLPTQNETTKRVRIERVTKAAEGSNGLRCFRCFKNHPIKGRKGRHVRKEIERRVRSASALAFILRTIECFGEPIPYYSKNRWHFHGLYEGHQITIALDHAAGLGRFSGYYMEIETILPIKSKDVEHALSAIDALALELLSEKRVPKISYRKMLMATWKKGKSVAKPKKMRKAKVSYSKVLKKASAKKK